MPLLGGEIEHSLVDAEGSPSSSVDTSVVEQQGVLPEPSTASSPSRDLENGMVSSSMPLVHSVVSSKAKRAGSVRSTKSLSRAFCKRQSSSDSDSKSTNLSPFGLGNADQASGPVFLYASKRRDTEFHSLFKEIAAEELLVEDYICALSEKILLQGKMYISEQHVCFYSNVFGYIRDVVVPFSKIKDIQRRNIAMIIPNSIEIILKDEKTFFFASFLSREETLMLLMRLWRRSQALEVITPTEEVEAEESPVSSTLGETRYDEASAVGEDALSSKDTFTDKDGEVRFRSATMPLLSQRETQNFGQNGVQNKRSRHRSTNHQSGAYDNQTEAAASGRTSTDRLLRKSGDFMEIAEPYINIVDSASNSTELSLKDGEAISAAPRLPLAEACDCRASKHNTKGSHLIVNRAVIGKLAKIDVLWRLVFGPESSENVPIGSLEYFLRNEQHYSKYKAGLWTFNGKTMSLDAVKPGCTRSIEFEMPTSLSIGPKTTDGTVVETILHLSCSSVCVQRTTRTPKVTNGDSFRIQSHLSLLKASPNRVDFIVTCEIQWLKSSFMRSIVNSQLLSALKRQYAQLGNYLGRIATGELKGLNSKWLDLAGADPSLVSTSCDSEHPTTSLPIKPLLLSGKGIKTMAVSVPSSLVSVATFCAGRILGHVRQPVNSALVLKLRASFKNIVRFLKGIRSKVSLESFIVAMLSLLFCLWITVMLSNMFMLSRMRKAVVIMAELESSLLMKT